MQMLECAGPGRFLALLGTTITKHAKIIERAMLRSG